MIIINASLRGKDGYYTIVCDNGKFKSIVPQQDRIENPHADIDAGGNLLCPPFVEPHIHLDAVLTAGEPRWNMSGTLFEGIECWAERKPMLTHDDVQQRVLKTVELLSENGIQHIRTHIDTTDPDLVALKAINDLRPKLSPTLICKLWRSLRKGFYPFRKERNSWKKHWIMALMSSAAFLILNTPESMAFNLWCG